MKKLLLILILTAVSSSAMAEWVWVAETDKEDFSTFYADPTTIRRSGNNVKMWVLDDLSTVKLDSLRSIKSKNEYDCKEKQSRVLFVAFYSEHMGGGETILIRNERSDWEPFPPDSMVGALLEFACSFQPKMPETFPEETFS